MIHLPTWLQVHSVEIVPQSLIQYEGCTLLEADVAIITRACPKRIVLLEGRDIYNKSESHRIGMAGMLLDLQRVAQFCDAARAWLDLPIEELGHIRFAGEHELGFLPQDRLRFRFQEYSQTPSKTDWMTIDIQYVNGEDHGAKRMHIDYTCLEEFVAGWESWNDQHDNPFRQSRRSRTRPNSPHAP